MPDVKKLDEMIARRKAYVAKRRGTVDNPRTDQRLRQGLKRLKRAQRSKEKLLTGGRKKREESED